MILKLAWRNLWRNKRRSFITIASILFAVLFVVFMRAFQLGSYEAMTRGVVNMYTGYAQIHLNGYWDDQTLDNVMPYRKSFEDSLLKVDGVKSVIPRLEGFALSSFVDKTKGTLVIGANPEKEKEILKIEELLFDGEVISSTDNQIMISEGLADYYKMSVSDTLVLLGQGYHGMSAAGKYAVKGIIKFRNPTLNQNTVIMSIPQAQWFFSTGNQVTSLILEKEEFTKVETLVADVSKKVDLNTFEVLDWKTMLPELVQSIEADNVGGVIMAFILYMIIFFGIFGTILMMTAERKYEFGILISIGMKRIKLGMVILYEIVFLGIIGVLSGYLLVYPLIIYFYINPVRFEGEFAKTFEDMGFEPIIPTSLDPAIPITHALIILIIALVLSIYPILKIQHLKPTEARRL
jgi:putative ABC transport system permease protein